MKGDEIMGQVNTSTPAKTYTLSDFIALKSSDELTYRHFAILEKYNNIEFLDHNLISDYLYELDELTMYVPLNDEQYKKYKYRPDLLAYDVYGSTQLDFIVMYMNGVIDPKEFDFTTVKLVYNSQLKEFLSEIETSESEYLSQTRADNNISD